ncbi:type II CAAX prenyl endopeptidase Rce1 family protein [Marinicrinis lubricantis]
MGIFVFYLKTCQAFNGVMDEGDQTTSTIVVGLLCASSVYVTNSLLPAIIFHMLWNSIAFLL